MKRLVAGLAFLSSVVAFLVIVGGGLFLLVIENSGERGAGALLALSGSIAFAAALIVLFANEGTFAGRGGRGAIAIGTLLGTLPVAAIALGVLRFSGLPYGRAMPLVDWSAFVIGIVLALGAVSILATGWWRIGELEKTAPAAPYREAARRPERLEPQRPPAQPVWPVEPQRAAPQPARPKASEPAPQRRVPLADSEDEVRVTPVELPSIGQFRRR